MPGVLVPLDPLEPLAPLEPLVAVPWLDDPDDPEEAFETVFDDDVVTDFLALFASAPRGKSPPSATASAANPSRRKPRRVL